MRLLPFLSFMLVAPCAGAQHCGFDFALIVVRPHAAGDSAVVDGLGITLLDSNNVPLGEHGRSWYLFHPNTDPKDQAFVVR